MDLSLVQFEQDVAFTSITVEMLTDNTPAIVLRGADYRLINRVVLNDVDVEFTVEDAHQLIVPVPDDVTQILSLRVVSGGPIQTEDPVRVMWRGGLDLGPVTGISALVQRVLKVLLTRQGTNAFSLDEGAGLHTLVGTNDVDRAGSTEFLNERVRDTETYLLNDPNFNKLPPEERLDAIEILSSTWNREQQSVDLLLSVTNQLGQTASVQVNA